MMLRSCGVLPGSALSSRNSAFTLQPAAIRPQQTAAPTCRGNACSVSSTEAPTRPSHHGRRALSVQARGGRYGGGGGFVQSGTPEVVDRLISAVPYLLPFLNSFIYARFLYHAQPIVRACLQPFIPIITPFHSMPFANVIAFFGIYIGIVNNKKMSRFVRFNAVQAILLDILLVLPRLIEVIITPPMAGWGKQLYINLNSALWMFITVWVVYGICSSFLGQYGRIPFVAEAADEQIR